MANLQHACRKGDERDGMYKFERSIEMISNRRRISPFGYSKSKGSGRVGGMLKDVKKTNEKIEIGKSWEPKEGLEYPVLIKNIRETEKGYIVVECAIFGEGVVDKSFFYKMESSALTQLRKFASLFPKFDGDISKIVGECVLAELRTTSYGFEYLRGIKALTLSEAEKLASEFAEKEEADEEDEEDEEDQEDEEDEEDQEDELDDFDE